jgi:hypothetical protein
MSKSRWNIPAALLLLAAFAYPAHADTIDLRGEVQRGDTIVHPFEHDGQMFEFRLAPLGYGWSIWVGDPMNRERNHVVVGTPPYRGINPAVIQGWHFRNADNTGPNKPGEGNVNAPGETRKFAFVLDGGGYQAAREALDILMWPEDRDNKDIQAAEERLKAVPKVWGIVEIEALELGNLIEGEQAWIDRLAFRVRLRVWPEICCCFHWRLPSRMQGAARGAMPPASAKGRNAAVGRQTPTLRAGLSFPPVRRRSRGDAGPAARPSTLSGGKHKPVKTTTYSGPDSDENHGGFVHLYLTGSLAVSP